MKSKEKKLEKKLEIKKKSEITSEYEYLKVDGRYFKPKKEGERVLYIETSKDEFDNRVKLIKAVAVKMKNNLNREMVLMEALSRLDDDYLEAILGKLVNPQAKAKITTRKHHCVDMKVGRLTIPIIN